VAVALALRLRVRDGARGGLLPSLPFHITVYRGTSLIGNSTPLHRALGMVLLRGPEREEAVSYELDTPVVRGPGPRVINKLSLHQHVRGPLLTLTNPQSGTKSSRSSPLIRTAVRQIPARSSANQEKGIDPTLRAGGPQHLSRFALRPPRAASLPSTPVRLGFPQPERIRSATPRVTLPHNL